MMNHLNPMKRVMLSLAVVALSLMATQAAQANNEVYEKTLNSTAWIKGTMMGTGVLVDREKRILVTNYHVVGNDVEVKVFFPTKVNGDTVSNPNYYVQNESRLAVPGKVLARDVKRDLALVQVNSLPAGVIPIKLAAKSVKPGETIHTIGSSGAVGPSGKLNGVLWRYTEGKARQVYQLEMNVKAPDGSVFVLNAMVLENQMPINPGDSGGPVVNDKGELVGVNQSTLNVKSLVNYGVDISEIKAMLAEHSGSKPVDSPVETAKTDPKPADSTQKPSKRQAEPAIKE